LAATSESPGRSALGLSLVPALYGNRVAIADSLARLSLGGAVGGLPHAAGSARLLSPYSQALTGRPYRPNRA
jgi:hypothetical protein